MASSELHDVVSTKAKLPDTLSRCCLDGINIAMLTLTFLVFAIRFILRVMGKKAGEAQDILSYIAYVCYVLMVVMYLENDPLYRAESVLRGERPAYQGLREYFVLSFLSQLDGVQPTRGLAVVHDAGMVHRWMTAGQLLFYACLTFVKLSLLAFYRLLVSKAGPRYIIIWWAVLGFYILVSIMAGSLYSKFINNYAVFYRELVDYNLFVGRSKGRVQSGHMC